MKRCPMCSASAPDGAQICYECLYSFENMSCVAVAPRAAAEPSEAQERAAVQVEDFPVPAELDVLPEQFEVCVNDDELGRRIFDFSSGSLHVGRLPINDIVLNDHYVSRRHLHIYYEGGQVWVEDFGSSNPARINGVKLSGKMRFRVGDIVDVRGSKIQLLDKSSGEIGCA